MRRLWTLTLQNMSIHTLHLDLDHHNAIERLLSSASLPTHVSATHCYAGPLLAREPFLLSSVHLVRCPRHHSERPIPGTSGGEQVYAAMSLVLEI